jgi:hypothetical protein
MKGGNIMKKIMVLWTLFFLSLSAPAMAQVTLPFSDDFESYTAGNSLPSPWINGLGGPGIVSTAQAHSGTKSATPVAYFASSVLDLGTDYPDFLEYAGWIFYGNGSAGIIGFHEQFSNMLPIFNAVRFTHTGEVRFESADKDTGFSILIASDLSTGWHHVRVQLNFRDKLGSVWFDGVQVLNSVSISPKDWVVYEWDVGRGEGPLIHIGFSHYGGAPIYFDDFSVTEFLGTIPGTGIPMEHISKYMDIATANKEMIKILKDFLNGLRSQTAGYQVLRSGLILARDSMEFCKDLADSPLQAVYSGLNTIINFTSSLGNVSTAPGDLIWDGAVLDAWYNCRDLETLFEMEIQSWSRIKNDPYTFATEKETLRQIMSGGVEIDGPGVAVSILSLIGSIHEPLTLRADLYNMLLYNKYEGEIEENLDNLLENILAVLPHLVQYYQTVNDCLLDNYENCSDSLVVEAYCPIELAVIFPNGLEVSQYANQVLGSTFEETDLNGDSSPDYRIVILFPMYGDYIFSVTPLPDSQPTDSYTIEITRDNRTETLVENEMVQNIPAEGYMVGVAKIINIDIKPGSFPNCFNNDGKGVIPVAILGSADFDITNIDPTTVQLESLAVKAVGKGDKLLAHIEDTNNDGYDDFVIQIQDSDGAFSSGDGFATLTSNLYDGTPIEGTDSICVVP